MAPGMVVGESIIFMAHGVYSAGLGAIKRKIIPAAYVQKAVKWLGKIRTMMVVGVKLW